MRIIVEYDSEVLGKGKFWEGDAEDIDTIKNTSARISASRFIFKWKENKCGMFTTREADHV